LSSREKKVGEQRPVAEGAIQDCSISIDGIHLHFQKAGAGPALVLLHGLLGHCFSWRRTIPALATKMTVYAPDMPGAGFSDSSPDMDCSLESSAKRLLRFMDALQIEECDLLGSSHGGAVAMMATALEPKRVRRMILAAPVNPWSDHGKFLTAFLSSALVAPSFLGLAPQLRILHEFYFRRMFGDPRRIRPGTLDGYMKPLLRREPFQYAMKVIRSWNQDLRKLRSILPRVANIPVLLIWGSLDTAVNPSSSGVLRRQFHTCKFVMMEGVGHLPYEEVPDDFNRAVAEFLLGR